MPTSLKNRTADDRPSSAGSPVVNLPINVRSQETGNADEALLLDLHDAESIPSSAKIEIDNLLSRGDLFRYRSSAGSPVSRLEDEFAALMGTRFALAVTSCSSALFLSLKALDLKPGAKVLLPAFTFAAVPSAVVHAGCKPVLVEVGDNYRIDIRDFESKLKDGAEAVMISHMRGHTSDMDAIMQLCDAFHVPVIEDAAHSLGTLWNDRKIGTIGRIGCFSFQSYKLMNAGEGGMLITDDEELIARAVIMSGAYEYNWRQHAVPEGNFRRWQNRLPLYNMRMNNLSAAVISSQIEEIPRRVRDGWRNHEYVADLLNSSHWLHVPAALPRERRAPDSIQFNLRGFETDDEARAFQTLATDRGVPVQVFGLAEDNARAFWNWEFFERDYDLPKTRGMLMRACDVRLPARLKIEELDFIAATLICSAEQIAGHWSRSVASGPLAACGGM